MDTNWQPFGQFLGYRTLAKASQEQSKDTFGSKKKTQKPVTAYFFGISNLKSSTCDKTKETSMLTSSQLLETCSSYFLFYSCDSFALNFLLEKSTEVQDQWKMLTAGGQENAPLKFRKSKSFFLFPPLTFSSNSNNTFAGSCIIVAKNFKGSNYKRPLGVKNPSGCTDFLCSRYKVIGNCSFYPLRDLWLFTSVRKIPGHLEVSCPLLTQTELVAAS